MVEKETIRKVRDGFRSPSVADAAKTQMACLMMALAANLMTAAILRALGW